ncbi:MAG: glycosyltransferase, partial [Bacteroidia bacterium]|nr:glycosyltransferase [Bacteroidia bacterium]
MNILHLNSEKTWRGGEQQIAYLIDELNTKGVHNLVACKRGSAFAKYCVEKSIQHITLNFSGSFDLSSANAVKRYCSNNDIDIVHMHSGNSHSIGVISSLLGNKSKLVLSRRVDFPVKNNWLSKYKFNYNKIEKIICVSKAIKAMILPSIKDQSKVTVVYSGLDLSRFSASKNKGILHTEYNLKNHIKIVANVSAIAPHKDYKTFVLAAKQFLKDNKDVKFFIIGDGPSKTQIEKFISENNMNEHIILTGFRT